MKNKHKNFITKKASTPFDAINHLEDAQIEIVDRIAEALFEEVDAKGEIGVTEINSICKREKNLLIKSFNGVRQDIAEGNVLLTAEGNILITK